MSKWYGSLQNRLAENQKDIPEIYVGMGVTEYLWSDRHAYEVTKVINQKDVFIRQYDVKNVGAGFGDNTWELISNPDGWEIEIVYRYGGWYRKDTYTKEGIEKFEKENGYILIDQKVYDKAMKDGVAVKYEKMNKLRFGVADYYYDFEF